MGHTPAHILIEYPSSVFLIYDTQVVAAGETDDEKLIDMILQTKQQVKEQGLSEIVQMFILTAEYSRRCKMSAKPAYDTIAES